MGDPSLPERQLDVDLLRDHWKGAEQPEVTVVMYGDFECPYTRLAYHAVQSFEADLADRLRFVFRHFPLTDKHPHALLAAQSAEAAADQDAYWNMHDLLFHRQKALEPHNLRLYAEEVGLELGRYDRAVDHPEPLAQRIADDRDSGVRNGVHGTPTIFINGVRYDDSRDPEPFRAAIERTT